jgi:protein-tyrosine phosphatase
LASAAKFGFDFSPVTARQLQPAMVEAADLVLTATTEHRGDVVRAVVSANRKTFTIKEFARVLEFLTGDLEHLEELDRGNIEAVDGVHALLAAASKYRGFTPPRQNSDDVVDPWGLSQEIYDSVTIELIDLTSKIAEKLGEAAK